MSFTNVLDIHVHDIHTYGMMDLASYLASEKITDAALAVRVGCDRSMIAKIRSGRATPSLPLALAINRETGVPVEALVANKGPAPQEAAE